MKTLEQVENENAKIQNTVNVLINAIALRTPNQTVDIPTETAAAMFQAQPQQNIVHNFTSKNTQNNQNVPVLPRMIFPHSKVTINYNFGK